jgi:hypothetical protein
VRRSLAILGLAFIIPTAMMAGCAHQSVAQVSERADTDAADAYVAIASLCNAYEAAKPTDAASAETIKRDAWAAFSVAHGAYLAGQTPDLTDLGALLIAAKALGEAKS